MKIYQLLPFFITFVFTFNGYAGEADVLNVDLKKMGQDTYQFSVTISHADEGWDHYANKWDIIASDGTILGTRILQHPHVDEQPFTRSLSGVKIPAGVKGVSIRAHDTVHEYGGETVTVTLPQ